MFILSNIKDMYINVVDQYQNKLPSTMFVLNWDQLNVMKIVTNIYHGGNAKVCKDFYYRNSSATNKIVKDYYLPNENARYPIRTITNRAISVPCWIASSRYRFFTTLLSNDLRYILLIERRCNYDVYKNSCTYVKFASMETFELSKNLIDLFAGLDLFRDFIGYTGKQDTEVYDIIRKRIPKRIKKYDERVDLSWLKKET